MKACFLTVLSLLVASSSSAQLSYTEKQVVAYPHDGIKSGPSGNVRPGRSRFTARSTWNRRACTVHHDR